MGPVTEDLADPTLTMVECAGVCFLPWVEKLEMELLEENVPLEAGRGKVRVSLLCVWGTDYLRIHTNI